MTDGWWGKEQGEQVSFCIAIKFKGCFVGTGEYLEEPVTDGGWGKEQREHVSTSLVPRTSPTLHPPSPPTVHQLS